MSLEKQFSEVIQIIKKAQANAYKIVNIELINCYWQVGEYISHRVAGAVWGDKTINDLAVFIEKYHPDVKGFNRANLYRMRQFFDFYSKTTIVAPVGRQLQDYENQQDIIVSSAAAQSEISDIRETILVKTSWTNHKIIIGASKLPEEREFYIRLAVRENYGKRELERQIKSGFFERFVLGEKKLSELLKDFKKEDGQTFKDNYIFEFLNLPKTHNESDLQKALISQMKDFILEKLCKALHNISYVYGFIM